MARKLSLKSRLMELSKTELVNALLDLDKRDETGKTEEYLTLLTAVTDEQFVYFKKSLQGIKRRKKFIEYGQSFAFAKELDSLLDNISNANLKPAEGLELMTLFFLLEESIFSRCDDSSGSVQDCFHTATNMFAFYAAQCSSEESLKAVQKLSIPHGYGDIWTNIWRVANSFLNRDDIDVLEQFIDGCVDSDFMNYYLHLLCAEALCDIEKYNYWSLIIHSNNVPLAHLETAEKAMAWEQYREAKEYLEKDINWDSRSIERDTLLAEVYFCLGDTQKTLEISKRMFWQTLSVNAFDVCQKCMSSNEENAFVAEATREIEKRGSLTYDIIEILMKVEDYLLLEELLVKNPETVRFFYYGNVLQLIDTFHEKKQPLIEILLYRALVEETMMRAQSKYYKYAVRYLKACNKLAEEISDWRGAISQDDYLEEFEGIHKRKSAFLKIYRK